MALTIKAWPVVQTEDGWMSDEPRDGYPIRGYEVEIVDDRGRMDWARINMLLRPNRRTGRIDHIESITLDHALTERPVTAATLRAVADQLDALVAAASLQVGESLERRLDAVAATGRKGEELVEVVETYLAAQREGLPPFQTTMERLSMSRSALARKVAKARDLDLLPPRGNKTDKDNGGE